MNQNASCVMMKDPTTIKLERTTRDRLAAYGTFGDTFDSILTKVLDELEKKKKR